MTNILQLKFDHIFFTGSTSTAKHIAAAAAKNLTPTVLELGGQGPAIVLKSADINLAAKRIAAAKFSNAGQICLTVNHVFADPVVCDQLVERLCHWNAVFSGKPSKGAHAAGMTSIISEQHFDRLKGLLKQSRGNVVYGGEGVKERLHFDPTVVADVQMDDSLMREEVFGPICPVVRADYKRACEIISSLPHPLAIYVFGKAQREIDFVLDNTISGGVTINDTFMHATAPNTPFGGVGDSGSGAYHGPYGIAAFSHKRTIVKLPSWLDLIMGFRYPPFSMKNVKYFTVKNTLDFKRGERLEDQSIRSPSFLRSNVPILGVLLTLLAVFMYKYDIRRWYTGYY